MLNCLVQLLRDHSSIAVALYIDDVLCSSATQDNSFFDGIVTHFRSENFLRFHSVQAFGVGFGMIPEASQKQSHKVGK